MPKVSVILPTCDRPTILPRALQSALDDNAPVGMAREILVVDNNRFKSPLRDQPHLRPWLDHQDVRVVDVRSAHNAAAARNAGLDAATGDWIAFLDDDDEALPGRLIAQLALAQTASVPLVLAGYELRLGGRRRMRQVQALAFSGDALLTEAVWGAPFIIHRRSPVRFDETLGAGEDLLYGQALLAHWQLERVLNLPSVVYRVHRIPGPRVNVNAGAIWTANARVLVRYGACYSRSARRLFAHRARLARCRLAGASITGWTRAAVGAWRAGGAGEMRAVLNALAFRLPLLRRWLVS